MPGELAGQRALAVGRERHVGDVLADHHVLHQLDLLAGDRQHAHRVVGAVGDQRQVASAVDRHARGLPADGNRVNQPGWAGRQVDDIELVLGRGLPAGAVGHPVHRIGHQRELAVGRDREVGGWAEDRVRQRQGRHDLGVGGVSADIDDRHQVLARRRHLQFAVPVPGRLVVQTHHHELRLAWRRRCGARRQNSYGAQQCNLDDFHRGSPRFLLGPGAGRDVGARCTHARGSIRLAGALSIACVGRIRRSVSPGRVPDQSAPLPGD